MVYFLTLRMLLCREPVFFIYMAHLVLYYKHIYSLVGKEFYKIQR